ncbi:hypothetical protein Lfu02_34750 [Longispora fulva]|uniref:Uncharacterized protein YheU (UPF0270 family) n=1 Tax=Longispora fulva TaxID=619741 RepID=A0A8J7KPV8_9ACTN|nr:DUF397 domain-containing protein [Longispora fulva]MBG6141741.1 uncharacterized protein YheU (UPF0270 family) [Longispora fulva]GIG59103.1 hypothetical protein Lfu02_34750 [Longispora fulva]
MTTHLNGAPWRKSNRSGNDAACVEVALLPQVTGVRDSKDQGGPVLIFSTTDWVTFTVALKAGAL